MHFAVVQGDIADQSAHILVNTTSPDLAMDCGVAVSLRRNANGSLKDDVVRASDNSNTSVIVTDAYELDAQYVLHAIPFTDDRVVTEDTITAATRAVLDQSDELGYRSLVIPALGCGGGEYDLTMGARHICTEIWEFTPIALADVRFIAHTEHDFKTISDAARAIKQSVVA